MLASNDCQIVIALLSAMIFQCGWHGTDINCCLMQHQAYSCVINRHSCAILFPLICGQMRSRCHHGPAARWLNQLSRERYQIHKSPSKVPRARSLRWVGPPSVIQWVHKSSPDNPWYINSFGGESVPHKSLIESYRVSYTSKYLMDALGRVGSCFCC